MEQSRAALRLQRLTTTQVEAAVLVDRPRRFERRRSNRFTDGVEVAVDEPPAGIADYEANLDAHARSGSVDEALRNGAFIGVTSTDLIIAGRNLFGRAVSGILTHSLDGVSLRWFDDEIDAMRSRYMHLDFPDDTWAVVATPWKRTIPADADTMLDRLGHRARRLVTLVPPGSEQPS